MKAAANSILLLFTVALFITVGSIGFLWSIVRLLVSGKSIAAYFYQIAFSLDQTGNTICQHFFNDLFIKPNGHRFGNPDETVSHVLGVNKKNGTLYPLGWFLAYLVNGIAALFFKDFHHVEKAASNEQ
jgi:hypothetical protein